MIPPAAGTGGRGGRRLAGCGILAAVAIIGALLLWQFSALHRSVDGIADGARERIEKQIPWLVDAERAERVDEALGRYFARRDALRGSARTDWSTAFVAWASRWWDDGRLTDEELDELERFVEESLGSGRPVPPPSPEPG